MAAPSGLADTSKFLRSSLCRFGRARRAPRHRTGSCPRSFLNSAEDNDGSEPYDAWPDTCDTPSPLVCCACDGMEEGGDMEVVAMAIAVDDSETTLVPGAGSGKTKDWMGVSDSSIDNR